MHQYVVMGRAGMRVARRRHAKGRVGAPHKARREETQQWFKQRVSFLVPGRRGYVDGFVCLCTPKYAITLTHFLLQFDGILLGRK